MTYHSVISINLTSEHLIWLVKYTLYFELFKINFTLIIVFKNTI